MPVPVPVLVVPVPVVGLNDLTFDRRSGLIYANIYGSPCLAKIVPLTGKVVGWVNLDGLYPDNPYPNVNVLNGVVAVTDVIAGTATTRLIVTGKGWPWLFVVEEKVRVTKGGAEEEEEGGGGAGAGRSRGDFFDASECRAHMPGGRVDGITRITNRRMNNRRNPLWDEIMRLGQAAEDRARERPRV